MDIDSALVQAFISAKLKDIKGTSYAYVPFMNMHEINAAKLDATMMSDKIIIYDKKTNYINISTLIAAFGENDSKRRAANYTRNGDYKALIESIETDLNSLPQVEKDKFIGSKAYDSSTGYIKANFIERSTAYDPNVSGTFVHRGVLIHALIWCNKSIAYQINEFVGVMLIREGSNNTKTLKSEANVMLKELKNDVEDRNKYILQAKSTSIDDDLDIDPRFNKHVFEALMHPIATRYIGTRKERIAKKIRACLNKCIVIVQYFDNDRFFADPEYDDYEVLVTFHIVSFKDRNKFALNHDKQLHDKNTHENIQIERAHIIGLELLSTIPFNDVSLQEYILKVHSVDKGVREENGKLIFPSLSTAREEALSFAEEYWIMDNY